MPRADGKPRKRAGSWSYFVKKFSPIPNPYRSTPIHPAYVFEYYPDDPETEILAKTPVNRVWTVTDGGGNAPFSLSAGYHLVNRMGYVITEKPWDKADEADCYIFGAGA